jgi:hypothetical protein
MKYSFWYIIRCYTKFGNGDLITQLRWDNLTFEVRTKWHWYFEYRAALIKVKYPKSYIEQTWGKKEITNESPEQLIRYKIKKRRTVLKRKITQFKNAIKDYEDKQEQLLIPDFLNEKYLRTTKKLKEYEKELQGESN